MHMHMCMQLVSWEGHMSGKEPYTSIKQPTNLQKTLIYLTKSRIHQQESPIHPPKSLTLPTYWLIQALPITTIVLQCDAV